LGRFGGTTASFLNFPSFIGAGIKDDLGRAPFLRGGGGISVKKK